MTWLLRRKFERAYRTLRRIADNHRLAGHDVEFVAVDETHLTIRCWTCHPIGEQQPAKGAP